MAMLQCFFPAMFCNFYLVINHKIAYNAATAETREKPEKNKQIFGIHSIFEFFLSMFV
jgi:hypothetical protein